MHFPTLMFPRKELGELMQTQGGNLSLINSFCLLTNKMSHQGQIPPKSWKGRNCCSNTCKALAGTTSSTAEPMADREESS